MPTIIRIGTPGRERETVINIPTVLEGIVVNHWEDGEEQQVEVSPNRNVTVYRYRPGAELRNGRRVPSSVSSYDPRPEQNYVIDTDGEMQVIVQFS